MFIFSHVTFSWSTSLTWSQVVDHDAMQKRVIVKTRKLASKAANIFSKCRKLGVMSRCFEDRTLKDTFKERFKCKIFVSIQNDVSPLAMECFSILTPTLDMLSLRRIMMIGTTRRTSGFSLSLYWGRQCSRTCPPVNSGSAL